MRGNNHAVELLQLVCILIKQQGIFVIAVRVMIDLLLEECEDHVNARISPIPTNMVTLDDSTHSTQSLSHPVHLITDCTHLAPIIHKPYIYTVSQCQGRLL